MLRRLVYVAAFALVGVVLLPAVVVSEVRLGFTTLAAAIAIGAWWVARRLPARPMSIPRVFVSPQDLSSSRASRSGS
jgi:hypothetical protein